MNDNLKIYQVGEHIRFRAGNTVKTGFIKEIRLGFWYSIYVRSRSGRTYLIRLYDILDKAPLLRDSQGRFRSKKSDLKPHFKFRKDGRKIFNKEIHQKRYKMGGFTIGGCYCKKCLKAWERNKPQDDFKREDSGKGMGGYTEMKSSWEVVSVVSKEKKPSERIKSIYEKKYKGMVYSLESIDGFYMQSILDYLDEQFEKGEK